MATKNGRLVLNPPPRARSQETVGLSDFVRLARITRRADFLKVAATQKKWVAPGLIVQMRAHEEPDQASRLGFTVSKKVGNAVLRNRAKRRLRALTDEMFREHPPLGVDLVVIGRAATVDRPFEALRRDLAQAVTRLGLG